MATKIKEFEYITGDTNLADMNFKGRLGWEAWAVSPKGTTIFYKREKKSG
jgi:hypothetical protein